MTRSSLTLFALLVLSLGLYAVGAHRPAPAQPQQANPDRFDDAHQSLFGAKTNPGEEAARITNEVAKGLPESGQATARPPPVGPR